MKVRPPLQIILAWYNKFTLLLVTIIPVSPNNVYTVEVQRQLSITCFAASSDDIVEWICKTLGLHVITKPYDYANHFHYAVQGEDPSAIGPVISTNSSDPFCPGPEPFIRNTNSSSADLRSDNFNGTQPENAGNYTCYTNGIPRATIEIKVLGIYFERILWNMSVLGITFITL